MHDHVHDHEIRSTGCNFILSFDSNQSFEYARKWLQQAIAYSRVTVDEDTLINGISKTTVFLLANTYAAKYWLPMRADVSPKNIVIRNQQVGTYIVKMPGKKEPQIEQLSLFEEDS